MNTRAKLATGVVCMLMSATLVAAEEHTDRVIVTLTAGTDPAAAAQAAAKHGAVITHVLHEGYSGFLPEHLIKQLRSDSDVSDIEPDEIVWVAQTQCVTQSPTPNWGLDRISERAIALDNEYQYEYTGAPVNVYVLDTGIDTNNADFGGRAVWGIDEIDGTKRDENGHGTAIAGTVGGTTYGVAKKVTLIAVRVLNRAGVGFDSDVMAGLEWATDNYLSSGKPAVAVLALEGRFNKTLNDAVNSAYQSGLGSVVAAGNDIADACKVSPASATGVFSVAATDDKDQRAWFSNGGTCVGIFAPGVDITSDWLDGKTRNVSGTSISAAYVAGVAALTLDEHRTWTFDQVMNNINLRATKGVINETPSYCGSFPWLCAPPSTNAMLFSACDI